MRSAWERRLCRSFMPALPKHCPVFWEGHCGEELSRAIGSTTADVVRRRCGSAAAAITATFTAPVSAHGSDGWSRVAGLALAINALAAGRIVMPPDNNAGGSANSSK